MPIWLTVLLILIAGAVAWPYLREAFKPRMTAKLRQNAPGEFAPLTRGLTHYQWFGAQAGPVVVCVHGLTTPSYVWGPVAERLGGMGFRVLVYDHYGRGYSDRPAGAQNADFFIAHLDELLDHLAIRDPITLMGYSMGGAVATAYAARRPERIREAVLIAPAGMAHDLGPIARIVQHYEGLGKWLMLALYPRTFRQGCEAERNLPSAVDNIVDRQIAELDTRGFVPAVYASLAGLLRDPLEREHRSLAQVGLPVLAIWGEDDDVIPLSAKDQLADWNPNVRQEVIEGAGHGLTYTHVNEVMSALSGLAKA